MNKGIILVLILLCSAIPVYSTNNSYVAFNYTVEEKYGLANYFSVQDISGNVYMIGGIDTNSLPIKDSYQPQPKDQSEIAILSFSPDGELRWSTYFGGSAEDTVYCVEIDQSNNIYIVGITASIDFPLLNPIDDKIVGMDAFVSSFTDTGKLRWSTYLGGDSYDLLVGSEIRPDGLYITGETTSSNFPLLDPMDDTLNGTSDGIVVKISHNGDLLWSSYIGESRAEKLWDIAVYEDQIFVVGEQTVESSKDGNSEEKDIQLILSSIDSASRVVTKSINIDSSLDDWGYKVMVDRDGKIYTAGISGVNSLIEGQKMDITIYYFSNDLELIWSRTFETDGWVSLSGLIQDESGGVIVAGDITTPIGNLTGGYQDYPLGKSDIAIFSIDQTGELLWSMYFGGSNTEYGSDLRQNDGILFLSGISHSSDLPDLSNPNRGDLGYYWFLYGIYSPYQDPDNDTLLSIEENKLGTDPGRADTDGDGIPDNVEVENGGDPLVPDFTLSKKTPLLFSAASLVALVIQKKNRASRCKYTY